MTIQDLLFDKNMVEPQFEMWQKLDDETKIFLRKLYKAGWNEGVRFVVSVGKQN